LNKAKFIKIENKHKKYLGDYKGTTAKKESKLHNRRLGQANSKASKRLKTEKLCCKNQQQHAHQQPENNTSSRKPHGKHPRTAAHTILTVGDTNPDPNTTHRIDK
jgi:hypothetical protein